MTRLLHRSQALIRVTLGVFGDDGIYTGAMVIWVALAVTANRVGVARAWTGILLTLGLDVIFVLSIILHAHRALSWKEPE
jgi:hypothetical protein